MTLLDGRTVATDLLAIVAGRVSDLQKRTAQQPHLVIICVGKNPASLSYIKQKRKACTTTGVSSTQIDLPDTATTEEVIKTVQKYNDDQSVHGILVQLPLPQQINTPLVIRTINPAKDVDGFHAYNLGKMFLSKDFEGLAPATPKGVIRLLEAYKIDLRGKEVVVIGHSNIVGKPLSMMFLNRNATVTTCHIDTKNLAEHTRKADIIAVGVGKINLLTADMVKDGAVVIDIGINRRKDGTLCGDVDFENVSQKTSFITPVPGGCGPMTVAALLENTVYAFEKQAGLVRSASDEKAYL